MAVDTLPAATSGGAGALHHIRREEAVLVVRSADTVVVAVAGVAVVAVWTAMGMDSVPAGLGTATLTEAASAPPPPPP